MWRKHCDDRNAQTVPVKGDRHSAGWATRSSHASERRLKVGQRSVIPGSESDVDLRVEDVSKGLNPRGEGSMRITPKGTTANPTPAVRNRWEGN